MDAAVPQAQRDAPVGTVIETCPAAAALIAALAQRLDVQGGAALFVDYGHLAPRTGSTLQAVRGHARCDVFAAPGEMDLTAHVDFAALVEAAARAGIATATTTQGEWLTAMGIDVRAQALTARTPGGAEEIAAARDRLVGTQAMGELFKCMAMSPRDWPRGAGFPEGQRRRKPA